MIRVMTLLRWWTAPLAIGLVVCSGAVAHADPPKPAGDAAAAAQALFYEARTLMRESKYALACPKLEESLRLDYGMGTEFNLADCNEKLGKVASAWSGFINVAAAAKSQGQPQREKVARDRAKNLEPRLPKLTIDASAASSAPDLEVKRDGVAIGSASWGAPAPVDPGPHRITASAPGKQLWETTVTTTEGKLTRVGIPALVPTASVATAPPPPVITESPVATRAQPFPEPIVERGGAQRAVGFIIGGLGVASLGVSAGFAIDSLQKRNEAKDHCAGDLCDASGVELRDRAMNSGDVATITGIAGGAALLGGAVLVFTAPRGSRKEAPPAATSPVSIKSFRAAPHVATTGGGLSIQGVFQ
jgi:hypothetical protein